jgi:hypothetical protein
VGVSPWGVLGESEYLENAKPVLDILLGSGSGVGFSGKPSANGRTLWMHTYNKGKAVYAVDVLSWPGSKDFKWEAGSTFTSQAVILDDTFTPAPEIEALFKGVPDPNDRQE